MSSNNTWAYVLLACCLLIGTLAYPQPAEDDSHDHDDDYDHGQPQQPGTPCIPRPHNDTDVNNPYSPNNFLPPVPGEEIEIDAASYMVSLHDGDIFLCGAVLVSAWIVVASKTDLEGLDLKSSNYYVHERMGYSHRDHSGCVYRVAEIKIEGNIAILKTMTQVNLVPGFIEPIPIASPDHPFIPDAPAQVIGWGHPKREDREGSKHTQLHSLTVTMKSDEYCIEALGDRLFNSDEMLCATGHDGCTGNSPLIQDGQVIGFVASSFGCGEKGFPMMYITVANYHEQVQEAIDLADQN